MPEFSLTAVDDPVAQELLTEYFTSRQLGFVNRQAGYRIVFPLPESFTPPSGVFYVVRDGDAVLGCGGMRLLDQERGEIKHLWLREEARGRGTGRLLLTELERAAARLGARQSVLDTNESLTAAQSLYRSAGYREVTAYNDNPNATHWFAKSLDGGARSDPPAQ